jgi:hypothetical protein
MGCCSAPPNDPSANEKVAILRTFFYVDIGCFWIPPTVLKEVGEISDIQKQELHISSTRCLFPPLQVNHQGTAIFDRARSLMPPHKEWNDCSILAEAEAAGADWLLSFDKRFIDRLSCKAIGTRLAFPSEFWKAQGVPSGAHPFQSPHGSNPLSGATWWHW